MKILILFLMLILFVIEFVAANTWKKVANRDIFYQPTVYVGKGFLKLKQNSRYHILIGYESQNCTIQLPPYENIIADSFIYSGSGSAITIGKK